LLPAETLEFLRLLSNFETDTEKLIQIVLVGQPEVDEMLARRDMRQVAQRIALRARLGPLSLEESVDYMAYRLVACGAREMAQVMTSTAGWTIAEAAGGIPRRINILADNVLIAGFGADQRPVGSQLAAATVAEFQANSGGASVSRPRRFGLRRRAERLPAPGPHPFEAWQEASQGALAPPEPVDEALWELASRAPEPESPEPESNVVRPQFLGGRVGERGSAGGSSAWQLEVRPQERFRLRSRDEAFSGYLARRAGTSS
jgi:hypothetical protein